MTLSRHTDATRRQHIFASDARKSGCPQGWAKLDLAACPLPIGGHLGGGYGLIDPAHKVKVRAQHVHDLRRSHSSSTRNAP